MLCTKIVITLGPATQDERTLRALLEEGVDACRLNFSHGTLDEHAQLLAMVRRAAEGVPQPVAVLGDLRGPKIRVGQVDHNNVAGGMPLQTGDTLVIQRQEIVGASGRVSTNYPALIDEAQVGDRVLIDDGQIRLVTTEKTNDELRCVCTTGGVIQSRKGVNLPNTPLRLPALTDFDCQCVAWAIEHELDFLALSFVRSAQDVRQLRTLVDGHTCRPHLIAKIEKPHALEAIDEIIEVSDGLMIARGDLGVEMDIAEVPIIQKNLIRRCQAAGKPVIVATQMLQSMINSATATRAEVSDVANAVFDATDAVMLSGETSVGAYPLLAVHTMSRVAETTEAYLAGQSHGAEARMPQVNAEATYAAVARGVWRMVHDLDVKIVVLHSPTGRAARLFSKLRFPIPVVALATDLQILRQMAICFGVIPLPLAPEGDMAAQMHRAERALLERELASLGDTVVLVGGWSTDDPERLDTVHIRTLGKD